jgi:hypothetical protein
MFANGYLFLCFFSDWHMLCQIFRSCTLNICSQKGWVYNFYRVHFLHCLFGFALFYSLSLSSCSLLVHFSLVIWVSIFIFLCKHFVATIHLYHVHCPCCWVWIVLLFVVVLLLSTWSFPSFLFGFFILLFL